MLVLLPPFCLKVNLRVPSTILISHTVMESDGFMVWSGAQCTELWQCFVILLSLPFFYLNSEVHPQLGEMLRVQLFSSTGTNTCTCNVLLPFRELRAALKGSLVTVGHKHLRFCSAVSCWNVLIVKGVRKVCLLTFFFLFSFFVSLIWSTLFSVWKLHYKWEIVFRHTLHCQ